MQKTELRKIRRNVESIIEIAGGLILCGYADVGLLYAGDVPASMKALLLIITAGALSVVFGVAGLVYGHRRSPVLPFAEFWLCSIAWMTGRGCFAGRVSGAIFAISCGLLCALNAVHWVEAMTDE